MARIQVLLSLSLLMLTAATMPMQPESMVLLDNAPGAESIVMTPFGFFASMYNQADKPNSMVLQYTMEGEQLPPQPQARVNGARGLAISSDYTRLWVAGDDGVTLFSLSANGTLTLDQSWQAPSGAAMSNGLCLDENEEILYVTSSGYTLGMDGRPAPAEGDIGTLYQIDLASGTLTVLMYAPGGAAAGDWSPNGCVVQDNVVWMANMAGGIVKWIPSSDSNPANGIAGYNLGFDQALIDMQQGSVGYAADGIAFHGGRLFVSIWRFNFISMTEMPTAGKIYVCNPMHTEMDPGDGCTVFADDAVGCDIRVAELDDTTVLLLPSIMDSTVTALRLEGGPGGDDGDDGDGTPGQCVSISQEMATRFNARPCARL